MARAPSAAILACMDRSLTADDYRLLDKLNGSRDPIAAPPELEELPGWFRRAVAEESAWLGIAIPGDSAQAGSQLTEPAEAA
jgi:hypothetical protein